MFTFYRIFISVAENITDIINDSLKSHSQKIEEFMLSAEKFREAIFVKGENVDLKILWDDIVTHIDDLVALSERHVNTDLKLGPVVDGIYQNFSADIDALSEKEMVWFLLGFKNGIIKDLESSGTVKLFLHNQYHFDCYRHTFKIDEVLKRYFQNSFLSEFMYIAEKHICRAVLLEAEHFSKLHEKFEEFQDDMMFFDEFPQTVSKKRVEVPPVLERVDRYIAGFATFFSEIEKVKKEIHGALMEAVDKALHSAVGKAYMLNSPVVRSLFYSVRKVESNKEKIREKFLSDDRMFSDHFSIEISDWKKDLEISKYQIFTGDLTVDTVNLSDNKLEERYRPAFLQINKMLESTINVISSFQPGDFQKIKMAILKESRAIQKALREEHVPGIIDVAQKASILSVIKNFVQRIDDAIEKIDVSHTIFSSKKVSNNVTVSKSINVPLRELIRYKTDSALVVQLADFIDDIRKNNEKVIRKTGEIEKIVEYNMDAALSVMRNRDEEDEEAAIKAVTIAKEGLERALNLSNELLGIIMLTVEKIRTVMPEIVSEYLNQIEELTFAEKVIKLNIYLVRKRTVKNLKEHLIAIKAFSEKTLPELINLVAEYFNKTKKNYSKFKKITGLSQSKDDFGFFYMSRLNEMENRFRSMPYVYQRLFSYDSLPDRNFYIERKNVAEKLLEDFTYWKSGGFVSTVLVSEKGNGKTTFFDIARAELLKEHRIYKAELLKTVRTSSELLEVLKDSFEMTDASSIDELEQRIMSNDSRKIFFLENLQNMYLRTMDGFEAVERFLLFMERTQEKVFWIVSCNLYAWNYIDLAVSASRYFQKTIVISSLSSIEIEELIMKRHNSSGYDIIFEIPEEIRMTKKFSKIKNVDDRQNYLKKLYFEKLAKLSGGNIKSSILMWLSSIRDVAQDRMTVSADLLTDYPFIIDLPKEEKFALTTLIIHDALDPDDYSYVSRENKSGSSMMLLRLFNKGLLVRKDENFQIHPFIYRDVVRVLKSLNMLH